MFSWLAWLTGHVMIWRWKVSWRRLYSVKGRSAGPTCGVEQCTDHPSTSQLFYAKVMLKLGAGIFFPHPHHEPQQPTNWGFYILLPICTEWGAQGLSETTFGFLKNLVLVELQAIFGRSLKSRKSVLRPRKTTLWAILNNFVNSTSFWVLKVAVDRAWATEQVHISLNV